MPEQDTSAMATTDSRDGRNQEVLSKVMDVVRNCLTRLRDGDLFMDGLEKECYGRLQSAATTKDEDGKEQWTQDFTKFMGVVADVLVQEATGDVSPENSKKQKKIKKRWLKFLQENFEDVEEEIRNYGRNNAASDSAVKEGGSPSRENGSQPRAEVGSSSRSLENELVDADAGAEKGKDAMDANDVLGGDDNASLSSASHGRVKKKSKKKKKKDKKKKKKKKNSKLDEAEDESDAAASDGVDQSDADLPVAETKDIRDKIQDFDRLKEETLSKVPEEVRKRFRQPGFAKWSKSWLPVLELSPFDVPPGVVRDQWFSMFENCQGSGREMTRLIYWYGTENLEEAYSFLPGKKIVSYEEGMQKGYGEVPATIRRKQAKPNPKLTKSDTQIVKGLEQIRSDADLEPSERADWLPEWDEEFEQADEELEEEAEGGSTTEAPVQSKPKKSKKRKRKDKGDEKKKTKRKKKDKDKDKDKGAQMEEEVEGSAQEVEHAVKKAAVTEEPMDFDYSTAEEKDEAFSDDVESDSDGDEDFIEPDEAKKGKSKAKGASSRKKKSQLTGEERAEHEEKLAKRREADRKRRDSKRKKSEAGAESDEPAAKKPPKRKGKSSQYAEEQRRFDECEDIFLPIIQRLEEALKADDLDAAEQCVRGFQENVEKTTPSFIRHHQFGMFVKESRKKFKSKGRDALVNLCHDLTKDLKRVFNEKEASAPEGFEPKPRKKAKKEGASEKKRPKVDDVASAESSKPQQQLAIKIEDDAQMKAEVAIPKKEDESIPVHASGSAALEQMEQTQVSQPSKPARKAFSLKGMFERPKKAPAPNAKVPDRALAAVQPVVKKQSPGWLTGPTPPDDAMPQEDERCLAVEFLQDAFVLFPPDKVNVDASSLALEAAIFDWSSRKSSSMGTDRTEVYWAKIHDIVAALAGKKDSGSLVQKILDGEFAAPGDLLRMTRKKLNTFFEGHAA